MNPAEPEAGGEGPAQFLKPHQRWPPFPPLYVRGGRGSATSVMPPPLRACLGFVKIVAALLGKPALHLEGVRLCPKCRALGSPPPPQRQQSTRDLGWVVLNNPPWRPKWAFARSSLGQPGQNKPASGGRFENLNSAEPSNHRALDAFFVVLEKIAPTTAPPSRASRLCLGGPADSDVGCPGLCE